MLTRLYVNGNVSCGWFLDLGCLPFGSESEGIDENRTKGGPKDRIEIGQTTDQRDESLYKPTSYIGLCRCASLLFASFGFCWQWSRWSEEESLGC